jgi:hypothetical protein
MVRTKQALLFVNKKQQKNFINLAAGRAAHGGKLLKKLNADQ